MLTVDDFNLAFNDSDEFTSLTFDELDFENLYSLDLFGKDDFSNIVYLYYTKYNNTITFILSYISGCAFDLSYEIELDETDDIKAAVLNALTIITEYYDQEVANFFKSDEFKNSELGKYIGNILELTNENILHIADIIRGGCLDFKLSPNFDSNFAELAKEKPDEVVPIDIEIFLNSHFLAVNY